MPGRFLHWRPRSNTLAWASERQRSSAEHPANYYPFPEFKRRLLGTIEAKRREEEARPLEFGTRVQYGKADHAVWLGTDGSLHDIAFPNGTGSWKTAVCKRSEFVVQPPEP